MRRVDEAIREVLSDAWSPRSQGPAGRLRDRDRRRRPAPTCAMRGCSSASSAPRTSARQTLEGLRSAHGVLQRRVAQRAAHEAHADAEFALRRHRGPRDCASRRSSQRRRARRRTSLSTTSRHARRCLRGAARRRALRARHAREPRRRRARLARRDAGAPARARQGLGHVHRRRRVPAAYEYRFLDLDGLVTEPPDDSPSARSSSWTAATSTATRSRRSGARRDRILNIDHHHDNTRFGDDQPRRRGGLVHGRDRVGPHARPGRRADAESRRGALRRPRHRHRPLHVREHRRRART